MKKLFSLIAAFLLINNLSIAQEQKVQQIPCYTKHWVDSVNASSSSKMNNLAPVMIEWYVYEGQTATVPGPTNIVNVIRVKLEENCPEKTKK